MVRTGFQAYPGRATDERPAALAGLPQRHDLGMRTAGLLRGATTDNLALGVGDDAADAWVRLGTADDTLGKLQRFLQVQQVNGQQS